MGNCCTAPANTSFFKRTRKRRCLSSISNDDDDDVDDILEIRSTSEFAVQPLFSDVVKGPVLAAGGDDLLQRYRLGAELGRGEFGVTRLCEDLETGETLACKTISKRELRTPVDVDDVRREVAIMRSLPPHPNVVGIRDAYEDADAVHIVMEVCEGGELFDRIVSRGHYGERAAAGVFKTIVEVVQHCHEHGVMHRDLKPENFLFANKTENSPLKAIDFGLSVFFEPGKDRFKEIVGSPYYMAPEVLKRNYGPEADVWSAGVILYILLCGVPPFWAERDEGIAQAIVISVINFEREPWPKVSENAKDLVIRMLDPNPSTRWTATQVLEHPWLRDAKTGPNTCLGQAVIAKLKQFSAMNKFKKKALRVVAEQLSVDEIAGIKQMFHTMDTDNNGNLTFEEVKDGFLSIGEPIPDLDVQALMEAGDVDGSGTLDCQEFLTVSVHLRRISSDEHLRKAFEHFDKDSSGYIEIDELREALDDDKNSPSEEAIRDIIKDVDKDKDGRISYGEFEWMLKAGTDWRAASRQYSRAVLTTLSSKLFRDGCLQR